MISSFIFDGKSSRDFGLKVEQLPASVHPTRRGESYRIAGRNGTRRREDGTYENYTQPYKVWFRDFMTNRDVYQVSHDIATWLIGSKEYCRFEDTYEPEYYRLACFSGPLNIEAVLRKFGRATLEFDFQPEYYLKSGEKPITVMEDVAGSDSAEYVLHNPTGQLAHPLFKLSVPQNAVAGFEVVSSAGAFVVSTRQRQPMTIFLDCDSYAVTWEDGTRATNVGYSDERGYPTLPSLGAGNITIRNHGAVNKLEMIPRWWSL